MDPTGSVVVPPSRLRARGRVWLERLLICAVLAALGWFYWWTVTGDGAPLYLGQKQQDYFNLLMHGFLSGHLPLMRPVSPGLLSAENSYDPAKRPPNVGRHDVSYDQGHYYLYFGPTPVVTLFLPFRLLTGMELPVKVALWVLGFGGLLAGAAVWLDVRRRYYPESGAAVAVLGLLVIGVVSLVPALLRRPSFWEVPIASGYCCLMLALAGVYAALHARRPVWGLAAAAVAMGLAVGSRPTYVFGCGLLAVPVTWWWWRGRREGRWRWWSGRGWWWRAAAVAVPLGVVGAGLGLYNYLRFGNPLEFGLRYQLAGNYETMVHHLRLRFIPYNAYLYFFAPAQWGRYFPFVHFIHAPIPPDGYYSREYVWGAAVNLPVVWLALLAPLASWRRGGDDGGRLGAFGLTVFAAFAAQAAVLLCFNTAALRSMVDFTPALALAAALGLLVLERRLRAARRRLVRAAGRFAWGAAALGSVFTGAMISVQVHEVLAQLNPHAYRRIARWFDQAPAWLERAAGTKYGVLEITLWFTKSAHGVEPLVATGWEYFSDRLLVEYLNDHEVRFRFAHTSRNSWVSRAIPVNYRVPHVLRVQMGSLFPPAAHPFFRDMTDYEIGMLTRWLRVSLDGHLVFDCRQDFYEASPECLRLGVDPTIHPNEPGAHFSGEFLQVRRGPYERLRDAVRGQGSVRMQVRFQRIVPGAVEPLLSVGRTGNGAVVYVRYLGNDRAAFGIDQWGIGASDGPPVEMDEHREREIEVRLPSLYPPDRAPERQALLDRALVRVDGRVVFNRVMPAVAAGPGDLWIGENRVQSSVCRPEFQGAITGLQRILEGPAPAAEGGVVRLHLSFPPDLAGQKEPLVTTGRTGAGDFVFVRYVDGHTIQFGHDHWGAPLQWSAAVAVNYAVPHVVDVDLPSLHPAAPGAGETLSGELAVRLDGRPVWTVPAPCYAAAATEVSLGSNLIGGNSCGRYFRGVIFAVDRVPAATEDTAHPAPGTAPP